MNSTIFKNILAFLSLSIICLFSFTIMLDADEYEQDQQALKTKHYLAQFERSSR